MVSSIQVKSPWMMFVKSFEGKISKQLQALQSARPPLSPDSEVWGDFGLGPRWFDHLEHSRECDLLEKALLGMEISVVTSSVLWPTNEGLIHGSFNPFKLQVHLFEKKFWVFAHEAAHSMDYMSGRDAGGDEPRAIAQRELVACGAGYLLTCRRLGIYNPSSEVSYAKQKGATSEDLSLLKEHIWGIAKRLNLLMNVERD